MATHKTSGKPTTFRFSEEDQKLYDDVYERLRKLNRTQTRHIDVIREALRALQRELLLVEQTPRPMTAKYSRHQLAPASRIPEMEIPELEYETTED